MATALSDVAQQSQGKLTLAQLAHVAQISNFSVFSMFSMFFLSSKFSKFSKFAKFMIFTELRFPKFTQCRKFNGLAEVA